MPLTVGYVDNSQILPFQRTWKRELFQALVRLPFWYLFNSLSRLVSVAQLNACVLKRFRCKRVFELGGTPIVRMARTFPALSGVTFGIP